MHIYYNFIALLESLRGVTSNDSVLNIFRLKDVEYFSKYLKTHYPLNS